MSNVSSSAMRNVNRVCWPRIYGVLCIGVLLRFALHCAPFAKGLGNAVELSSCTTQYKRVVEALFLRSQGMSVYAGDIFHGPPLILTIFSGLQNLPAIATPSAFVIVDIIIAILLVRIAHLHSLLHLPRRHLKLESDSPHFRSAPHLPVTIAAVYMLNPLTTLSCVAMSTASVTHLAIVSTIYLSLTASPITAGMAFATAAYLDVYPLLLLPAIALLLHVSTNFEHTISFVMSRHIIAFLVSSATWTILLLWLSYNYSAHSWDFLYSSYGFVFLVNDLTPNIGIFWYFMTEIFDRFRSFFVLCLHGHLVVYVVPLCLRFWPTPLFLAYTLYAVPSLFKAYPVLADLGFSFTLLILQWRILPNMRRMFPVYSALAVICTITSVMWHLWIVAGSGNGNFFYFQTIVLNFIASFIILEAMIGVRRLYLVMNKLKK